MKQMRLVAAVLALALVAGACSGSKKASPRPAATASSPGAPATEADLRTQIRTQGLTPERAEELFALDIGPLPGVAVDGIKADDDNFDGTDAVSYLYAQWSHLTQAQQEAASKLLAPARTLASAATKSTRTSAQPQAVLLAARHEDVNSDDLLKLAQTAGVEEGTELGVPGISGFVIDISEDMGKAYAETHYYDPPVKIGSKEFGDWTVYPDGCHITVWEKKWVATAGEDAAAIMSHEVFHCYAQRAAGMGAGGVPNYLGIHDWVGEGEATWVMEKLHPDATVADKFWSKYAFSPETKYVDRNYDAVGVFGHEGDVAGSQDSVWPLLLPVNNAAVGGQDSAAFTKLLNSTSERFYSTWGASYYEDQSHTDWHMGGPGTQPTSAATPKSLTINAGDAQDIGLLGTYQATDTTIQSDADLLVVTLAAGYGKAHDQDYKVDSTLDNTAPLALCLNDNGCKCPDGSPGASEHTTKATSPISVGMDGGDQQLAAYAAGASLDSFCKKPDQPPTNPGTPPANPNGGGDGGVPDDDPPHHGGSAGDPHLSTFDGAGYDLQTVGEMTLVKSTTDDFNIQVRTAPLAGSNSIAINTAIATRASGHNLMIGEENGAIQARVDGKLVIDEVTHAGDVSLQRIGTSGGGAYVAVWPDGTVVHVDAFGVFGVNVGVTPSRARKGKLTGLLGNDDGRTDNYVTGDGHVLGLPPSRDALNTTYTDSWRVTPATSLFTYGPGQSTATFTDKTFPHTNVDANSAPGRAAIEQQCRAEGVTDPFLLADCIVDGSELHSQVVFSHYAQAQVVQSVRDALAHGRPPFSRPAGGPAGTVPTVTTVPGSGSALRTIVDVGRVNDPHESVPFSFPARAGDIIWIGAPGCDDGGLDFGLVDPTGKTVDQDQVDLGIPGCEVGRFALTADGDYQFVANVDKQRSGGYSVPIRFQRKDVVAHAQYGQTLSGTIPQPAAHDVYEFDAQAGDVVHIFGPGCNIGPSDRITAVGFEKGDGTPYGGTLDCTQGSQSLIRDSGTYRLVVNFGNEGPFPYSLTLQK